MTIICPLTKSPNPAKGRVGKTKSQDWYKGCKLASKLAHQIILSDIAIISDFHVPGCEPDAETYKKTLLEMGVPEWRLIVIERESETIGQIEEALELAVNRKGDLIFISSLLHWPRVWWITRNWKRARRRITFGLPRPKEALTDIIMIFLFPIIDLMGKRESFRQKVLERRKSGKL